MARIPWKRRAEDIEAEGQPVVKATTPMQRWRQEALARRANQPIIQANVATPSANQATAGQEDGQMPVARAAPETMQNDMAQEDKWRLRMQPGQVRAASYDEYGNVDRVFHNMGDGRNTSVLLRLMTKDRNLRAAQAQERAATNAYNRQARLVREGWKDYEERTAPERTNEVLKRMREDTAAQMAPRTRLTRAERVQQIDADARLGVAQAHAEGQMGVAEKQAEGQMGVAEKQAEGQLADTTLKEAGLTERQKLQTERQKLQTEAAQKEAEAARADAAAAREHQTVLAQIRGDNQLGVARAQAEERGAREAAQAAEAETRRTERTKEATERRELQRGTAVARLAPDMGTALAKYQMATRGTTRLGRIEKAREAFALEAKVDLGDAETLLTRQPPLNAQEMADVVYFMREHYISAAQALEELERRSQTPAALAVQSSGG